VTARDELYGLISRLAMTDSADWYDDVQKRIDGYRAQVLAEAAAELDRIADIVEAGQGPARMLRDAAGNVRYMARQGADNGKPNQTATAADPAPDYKAAVAEALRLLETAPEAFQSAPSQNIAAAAHVLRQANEAGGGK
jgi:hypothetical protein